MGFQTSVNTLTALGVPGQIANEEPTVVDTGLLAAAGTCTIGFYYTKNADTGIYSPGGDLTAAGTVPGGILLGGFEHSTSGATTGPLDPTLNVPNNSTQQFLSVGSVVVNLTGACKLGYKVQYNTTTGALSAVSNATATPSGGNLFVPASTTVGGASQGASVIDGVNAAAGLAIIRLS